jgi:hypothetical protein
MPAVSATFGDPTPSLILAKIAARTKDEGGV